MKFPNPNFQFPIKVLILIFIFGFTLVFAHQVGLQNIDIKNANERWAWNDVAGWIDFHNSSIHNIEVSVDEVKGWASSTIGFISFNCSTTPNGDICGSSNFRVNNDGNGLLSGFAWSDGVGWISFCGNSTGASSWDGSKWVCPSSPSYRVRVDKDGVDESHFKDWAWNDVLGWISFNCSNNSFCGISNYKIQTGAGAVSASAVLESNIFDTGTNNAYFNTMLWRGVQPPGTSVQIELATSNASSGPWNYSSPANILVNTPLKLIGNNYINRRYIRYRVTLLSDVWQTSSPQIDDIIINWSP